MVDGFVSAIALYAMPVGCIAGPIPAPRWLSPVSGLPASMSTSIRPAKNKSIKTEANSLFFQGLKIGGEGSGVLAGASDFLLEFCKLTI